MYKATARSLRRRTQVHSIAPQKAFIYEDHMPSEEQLTLPELKTERAQLLRELTRAQNELAGAKRGGNQHASDGIGYQIQSLGQRLSVVNDQIKVKNRSKSSDPWRQAVREVCPDYFDAILSRVVELENGDG